MILAFFGLFLCVAAVLVFGQYMRKVSIQGVLEPQGGQVLLISPENGTLRQVFVRPGDQVHAGDVVAEVAVLRKVGSDDNGGGETVALRDSIDRFRATRNLTERDGLLLAAATTDELRRLMDEAAQAKQELDSDLQAEQVFSGELATLKLLVAEGIRSTRELTDVEIKYLHIKSESARVRQNIARIEGKEADIKKQLQREKSSLSRQNNETEARINQLNIELDRALKSESFRITATHDGIIDSTLSQTGKSIQSGEVIATISDPHVPLQALMFVRPSDIGFVRPSDEVLLQIDAFPTQQFGSIAGKIISISSTSVINSQFKTLASLRDGERSYMAVVALQTSSVTGYGKGWRLQSGMTCHGYVALERQSLFRWLFNPVFAALGRNPYFLTA
ncbi:HlyD family secretion protein [Cupriavidus sp. D39]|uniref:HlyD family secretion protein n=1 Tax=Cupriavidus sp. D39 TaxID=2997877 RepID=UPI00227004A6|nr:HlyD family efflux transporter periplasmic adaptor subunit [Cupriavidus sp. D39]MCY0858656.1 HlyD family efflux transporter periplasmic adaptor subunit [Cupriavidus sp. D39]